MARDRGRYTKYVSKLTCLENYLHAYGLNVGIQFLVNGSPLSMIGSPSIANVACVLDMIFSFVKLLILLQTLCLIQLKNFKRKLVLLKRRLQLPKKVQLLKTPLRPKKHYSTLSLFQPMESPPFPHTLLIIYLRKHPLLSQLLCLIKILLSPQSLKKKFLLHLFPLKQEGC